MLGQHYLTWLPLSEVDMRCLARQFSAVAVLLFVGPAFCLAQARPCETYFVMYLVDQNLLARFSHQE